MESAEYIYIKIPLQISTKHPTSSYKTSSTLSLGVLIYDDLRLSFFLSQTNQGNSSRSGLPVEGLHVYVPTADSGIRTYLDPIQIKAGIVGLGHSKGNLTTRNKLMAYQVLDFVIIAEFPQHAKESIGHLVEWVHGPMDIAESHVT